jgi:hypothetical protein
MIKNEADLLEEAADLIDSVGHCKNLMWTTSPEGEVTGYCLLGALQAATQNTYLEWGERVDIIYKGLRALKLEKWGNPHRDDRDLVEWNNADERTGAEVSELMKQTAKEWRNGR